MHHRQKSGEGMEDLLSTCRTTVASACPAVLVALQMYWPESCWATRGMIRVLPSTWCCQGSGERSLDQWMVGGGLPMGLKMALVTRLFQGPIKCGVIGKGSKGPIPPWDWLSGCSLGVASLWENSKPQGRPARPFCGSPPHL